MTRRPTEARPLILTVRVSVAELAALDAAADQLDRPRAWVVRDALAPVFATAPEPVNDGAPPLPFG